MLAKTERITDDLGKGIDKNIKKPVAAFLLHGFTTSGSCEGHIAKNDKTQFGIPYPWIEVYAPAPKNWRKAKNGQKIHLEQEWKLENLRQQNKITILLQEFYKKRKTPPDARLVLESIGIFGGFRVQSFGAKTIAALPQKEKKQKLSLYRKEMNDFAKFLKDKYFARE